MYMNTHPPIQVLAQLTSWPYALYKHTGILDIPMTASPQFVEYQVISNHLMPIWAHGKLYHILTNVHK